MKNDLNYVEVPVGISEEKAETKKLKDQIAYLVSLKKIKEAKQLFDLTLKERPDVLLAGSDLTQELRMMYQILHLCLLEEETRENSLLSYSTNIKELIGHYKKILEIIFRKNQSTETKEDKEYIEKTKVSKPVLDEIKKNLIAL